MIVRYNVGSILPARVYPPHRWFFGQVVCALDYKTGDLGSIPGSGGITDWLFSAGWEPNQVLLECYQQYRPRLENRGGNDTQRGLCWKQVVPSIPGGDFCRLHMLNKRPCGFYKFWSLRNGTLPRSNQHATNLATLPENILAKLSRSTLYKLIV